MYHDHMTEAEAIAPRWIVSRRFDLAFFFGGAGLSLLFLVLYFAFGAPIVALWWIWLLAFDELTIDAQIVTTIRSSRI